MVIAYVDECGRGPLWGPVYAGAVIWDESKERAVAELTLRVIELSVWS